MLLTATVRRANPSAGLTKARLMLLLTYGQAPQGCCKLSKNPHLCSLETCVSLNKDRSGMFSER